jgi:hypothetical protein
MLLKYIKPSKIKNLEKDGNKRLVLLIFCSVSCSIVYQILTMTLKFLSLQFWSFWGICNQVHKKEDSNNYLCVNRLAF